MKPIYFKFPQFIWIKERNNYIFLSVIVALLNLAFCKNYFISLLVVLLQVSLLLFLIINRKNIQFFSVYAIFLALGMEFEYFTGNDAVYGFRKFDFLGLNISVWLLLAYIFFLIIIDGNKLFSVKYYSKHNYIFSISLIACFCISFVVGALNLMFDDNNITKLVGYKYKFFEETYMFLLPLLVVISMMFLLAYEKTFIKQIKSVIVAILIGVSMQVVFSYVLKIYGSYGENLTLLSSTVIILLPFIIILPFYQVKIPSMILILSVFSIFLELKYSASGKYILTLCLVGGLYLLVLLNNKSLLLFFVTVGVVCVLIICYGTYFRVYLQNNGLFQEKVDQVISMISFWRSDWLLNMSPSPKIRILEIYNTFNEYIQKPWLLLTGKGIGGSFSEHSGIMTFVSDAYSMGEWGNNTFISVHGTFAKLFLANGLMGVGLYFYILVMFFKHWHKSIWLVIGSYWFLLFYGYSLSLTVVGLSCLMVGLYEVDYGKRVVTLNENFIC